MDPIRRLPPDWKIQAVTTALSETQDWSLDFLGIPPLWKQTQGSGLTIAVLDTGVDDKHPDLQGAIKASEDFTGSPFGASDRQAHGCILPTDQIYTSLCGLQAIETAFDRAPGPVLLTQDGWMTKSVGRLGINTLSLNGEGRTIRTRIGSIHRLKYKGKMFRVKTRTCEVTLTPWHPLYIQTSCRGTEKTVSKRRADELKVGDHVCTASDSDGVNDLQFKLTVGRRWNCRFCGHSASGGKRLQCKKCNRMNWHDGPVDDVVEVDSDFGYLAGLVITDGHLTKKRNQYGVLFFNNNPKITAEFSACCERIGVHCKSDCGKSCVRTEANNKRLFEALRLLGIPVGNKSRTVEIPELICKSPLPVIEAFLAGIIDGDGCISGGKVRIATGSIKFAEKLAVLCRTLGTSANVSVVKPSKTGIAKTINNSYCVSISTRWSGRIKTHCMASKPRHQETIKSIEQIDYDGVLYDLTIDDGPDNYVANGLIVSNTWCAGMIGARAGNNIGVRGIMPKCQLLCGKVLGDNGAGYDQWIAEGVKWAEEMGADMISLSLGGPQMSDGLRQIFQEFVSRKGRFIFAAAGNSGPGSPPDYPGAWPECIAVAAVDKQGKVTDFSSRGPHVAIAAPGYEMLSTIPGGRYGIMSGTSMACPLACAVAGLALSKHRQSGSTTPLDTVQDLRDHLKKTAIPKGDSDSYGYGLIDPAALLADVTSLPPATQPPSPVAGGIWVWIPGGKTVGTF